MYKKIMVPLDGSELAECVLPHVEEFTRDCRVNTITLVRVIPSEPIPLLGEGVGNRDEINRFFDFRKKAQEERESSAGKYLDEVIKRLKKGEVIFQRVVLVGKVEDKLLEYAKENNIDMILIATHGRSGVSRWMRGSVAERILQGSHIPVLMVRAPGTIGYGVEKSRLLP
jgi:nucleotide-binding universal stress UspA family protein